jgi:membrane protein required for colicin V production
MNIIDILFIVLLFGCLATGFFLGTIRTGVLILAFYLSVVLSSLYYRTLGGWLAREFNSSRAAGDYIGFFILLIVTAALLAAAGMYTFRYVETPDKLKFLDLTGGLLLSVVLGGLVLGVVASLAWNLMVNSGGENIPLPLFGMLGSGVRNSLLLSLFSENILPDLYEFVDPVLPEGARLIFNA